MLATMKKRFGATWTVTEVHGAHHLIIRCVHGDDIGIYLEGDYETVAKSEWERWG